LRNILLRNKETHKKKKYDFKELKSQQEVVAVHLIKEMKDALDSDHARIIKAMPALERVAMEQKIRECLKKKHI
jgi:hypothetical protein